MSYIPKYENDGSGRDTFINYAGAYWLNPLPGGRYYKSAKAHGSQWENSCSESIDPFATQRPPYQSLYGKSRYGTTIVMPDTKSKFNLSNNAAATSDAQHAFAASANNGNEGEENGKNELNRSSDEFDAQNNNKSLSQYNNTCDNFDAQSTALLSIPHDVAKPEQRFTHPGHAMATVEGTNVCTFTGNDGKQWIAPNEDDCTLLRRAPLYESTCHYGLRTGRFYTADQAPAHEMTLPEKGTSWGKSHYY